jgi:hypothetical protein
VRVRDVVPRGRRRQEEDESDSRKGGSARGLEAMLRWAWIDDDRPCAMYESTITRVSDGSFREQRRVIHSEREKPRLIYMRGEPQDTTSDTSTIRKQTRANNRRGRGGTTGKSE